MVTETIREALDLFAHIRTKMLQHTTERTLKEMARLPRHLIDDVNARGFPPDRLLDSPARTDLPQRRTERTRSSARLIESRRSLLNWPVG
jgi:hypothetical protein